MRENRLKNRSLLIMYSVYDFENKNNRNNDHLKKRSQSSII